MLTPKTLFQKLSDYLSFNGFLVPQEEAEASIREGVTFRGTNMLILVFAILIASLGLNTNSTAVIIGAMLISPLMGPIIGLGLGIGVEDFDLVKRSLRNLLMAALFSVLASTVYFLISPVSEGHSELLARTSPTIYDVLIGLFGGGAGIVAIASKSKGNVIPGVAIATALMPPLCTVGYGLATLQLYYFLGALYLFLINSIFICIATYLGVKLMHYHLTPSSNPQRAKKLRKIVYTISILTLLPSIYLTYSMLQQERFQQTANDFVAKEFDFPATHVVSHSATDSHGKKTINVTLLGRILPTDSLQLALTAKLPYYGLQGTSLNIVQGDTGIDDSRSVSSMKEIYEIAQNTINTKQAEIDSLKSIIKAMRGNDSIAAVMAPELKVVFPQVSQIAVSKAFFGEVNNGALDTVNVALVHYSQPMSQSSRAELQRYLEARLKLKKVELVNVGEQ